MIDVDRGWLRIALEVAQASEDPSTRVGSVLVRDGLLVAVGYNRFPRGIVEDIRTATREAKLNLVVHAEVAAIITAGRHGLSAEGATLYTACLSADRSLIWGGPPCTRCAVHVIEAGVRDIVSYPAKTVPTRWREDLAVAHRLLGEAGIPFREAQQ